MFDVIEYGDLSSTKGSEAHDGITSQLSDESFASLLPYLKENSLRRFISSDQMGSLELVAPDINGLSGVLSHVDKFSLNAEAIADVLLWCFFESTPADTNITQASFDESDPGNTLSCKFSQVSVNIIVSANSLKHNTAMFGSVKPLADSKRIKVN